MILEATESLPETTDGKAAKAAMSSLIESSGIAHRGSESTSVALLVGELAETIDLLSRLETRLRIAKGLEASEILHLRCKCGWSGLTACGWAGLGITTETSSNRYGSGVWFCPDCQRDDRLEILHNVPHFFVWVACSACDAHMPAPIWNSSGRCPYCGSTESYQVSEEPFSTQAVVQSAQMPYSQWVEAFWHWLVPSGQPREINPQTHKQCIHAALLLGAPVPDIVLQDYPKLKMNAATYRGVSLHQHGKEGL